MFRVPLTDNTKDLGYILHRGDTKDPGPDQFLDFKKWGCEVWQLQGADPQAPYLLPIQKGPAAAGDLSKYKAHWIDRSTIAWNIEPIPNAQYVLHYAPDGGIKLEANKIVGGQSIKSDLRSSRPERRAEGQVAAPRQPTRPSASARRTRR